MSNEQPDPLPLPYPLTTQTHTFIESFQWTCLFIHWDTAVGSHFRSGSFTGESLIYVSLFPILLLTSPRERGKVLGKQEYFPVL